MYSLVNMILRTIIRTATYRATRGVRGIGFVVLVIVVGALYVFMQETR